MTKRKIYKAKGKVEGNVNHLAADEGDPPESIGVTVDLKLLA